jgi:DNA-binding response OmpR family regulator
VPPVLRVGDIEVDALRRTVMRAGRRVELTHKELGVLAELIRADGALLSVEDLLRRVWGGVVDAQSATVRTTIHTLRTKLGPPDVIVNVIKVGYRIDHLRS